MKLYDWFLDAGIIVIIIAALFNPIWLGQFVIAVTLLCFALFLREVSDIWHGTTDKDRDDPIRRMID